MRLTVAISDLWNSRAFVYSCILCLHFQILYIKTYHLYNKNIELLKGRQTDFLSVLVHVWDQQRTI